MNENNELLEYVYQTCDMGKNSLTDLLKALNNKDNKIKPIIEKQLKEYEKYYQRAKKLLKENKVTPKTKGPFTEMMSKMGISMNVMKDNSDSAMADMIMRGLTMGTIEMEKKIQDYEKTADKKIIKLAKEVLEFQENNIEDIKKFL